MTVKRVTKRPTPRRVPASAASGAPPGGEGGREEGRDVMPDNLFADMSQDAVVYIYRRDEVSKEPVFMYKLAPDESHVDEIQRLSGGGHYTCRERGRNEEGRKVWLQQRTLRVGGPPREPIMPKSFVSVDPAGESSPQVGTVPPSGDVGMSEILTAGVLKLLQGSADLSTAQAEAYKNMMTRPDTTNWEPLITAMVPVVVALIKKREDPMAQMQAAASLFKDNASPASAFRDQLKTVTEVFNLHDATKPEAPDPIDAAIGLLPQILDVITTEQKSGRPVTLDSVREKLTGGKEIPAPPQPQPGAPGAPVWLHMLRNMVPRITAWATAGRDPELLAEFFVAEIPEQYAGNMREFLKQDNAQEMLFRAAPALTQYAKWVGECFNAMADQYFPPDEGEGEPPEEQPATVEVGEVKEVSTAADNAEMAAIDAAREPEGE